MIIYAPILDVGSLSETVFEMNSTAIKYNECVKAHLWMIL